MIRVSLLTLAGLCIAVSAASSPAQLSPWFTSAKFGLMVHWAPVSQWGAEVSWPLVCERLPCSLQSANGSIKLITSTEMLRAHRAAYASLSQRFAPRAFNASGLAETAKNAGFRYMVLTTTHADGFGNFNTSFTNDTSLNSPFATDTLAAMSTAFRAQGLRVGAYYSPAIFTSPFYWSPNPESILCSGFPSYNPASQPEAWKRHMMRVRGQIAELLTQYSVDLLWLDDGDYQTAIDWQLEDLIALGRKYNPDFVWAQREGGTVQDYVILFDKFDSAAEKILSEHQMNAGTYFEVPSTIDMLGQWGYSPQAVYRNPQSLLLSLVRIVSKGGNYLLNIGLNADGQWDNKAMAVMSEIGKWLHVNGQAIYDTAPLWPFEYQTYLAVQPVPVLGPKFYVTSANFDKAKMQQLKQSQQQHHAKPEKDCPASSSPAAVSESHDLPVACAHNRNTKSAFSSPVKHQSQPTVFIHFPLAADSPLPCTLLIPFIKPALLEYSWSVTAIADVSLLGHNGTLDWSLSNDGLKLQFDAECKPPRVVQANNATVNSQAPLQWKSNNVQYIAVFKISCKA